MFTQIVDNPGYGDDYKKVSGGLILKTKYGSVITQAYNRTRELFTKYLKNVNNGLFVEIGVFGGASLLSNYDLCIQNNIKIVGIDPFEKIEIFNGKTTNDTNKQVVDDARNGALQRKNHLINIINHNKLNIQLLNENSYDVAENFKPNSIDLLHIDGDHSYDGVKKDLNCYWNKIKSGGIIINDDYNWVSCKRAIDEFIELHKNEIIDSYSPFAEKHIIIKR